MVLAGLILDYVVFLMHILDLYSWMLILYISVLLSV